MKIANAWTGSKAIVAKVFTLGLLAAAVALASPSKANAQVSFGVRFGAPAYGPAYAPAYRRPVYVAPAYGYYAPGAYDRFAWERRQEFIRHEERERFDRNHHIEAWGR